MGSMQTVEGLNTFKWQRKGEFAFCLVTWTETLVFSCLQTKTYTMGFPGHWVFGLGLDLSHQFSWSPSFQMIVDFLGLQITWTNFLIINLFIYIYMYIYIFTHTHIHIHSHIWIYSPFLSLSPLLNTHTHTYTHTSPISLVSLQNWTPYSFGKKILPECSCLTENNFRD